MKNWKTKYTSLLLAVALCLSLTACGNSNEPDADDNGNSDSDVTVEFNDDGRGDLIPDDGNAVPVLMGDALPFTNVETLESEQHEDGTYYYEDMAEDGLVVVVNTVLPRDLENDTQTPEEYLTDCALSLAKSDTCILQNIEQNVEYTEKMTYPVYIVTFTAGNNEDSCEWTVFAMDTDLYTYLYGFRVPLDSADDVRSIYQDIFAGLDLRLPDGE